MFQKSEADTPLLQPFLINDLGKMKISFTTQLDDTKRLADAEARDRATLLSKFKNPCSELESMRERIEEESEQKAEILKQLSKAQAEIQLWRSRNETEGLGRIDELEGNKAKLGMRLQEAEETIDSLHNKVASTEKTKNRLDTDAAIALWLRSGPRTLTRLSASGR